MDKDRDGQLDSEGFSLEEILAEFSSRPEERISAPKDDTLRLPSFLKQPPPKPPGKKPPPKGAAQPPEKVIPFPQDPDRPPAPRAEPPAPKPKAASAPKPPPQPVQKPGQTPPPKSAQPPQGKPKREDAPLPEQKPRLKRLLKKADDYAEHMFEEEEPDPEALRAERLLPGVDQERPAAPKPARVRKPKRKRPTAPDLSAQELAGLYGKGLAGLRMRRFLVFLLAVPLLYLALTGSADLPLPALLADSAAQTWLCFGIHALALLLSLDLVRHGLTCLGPDTLTTLAAAVTLADAFVLAFAGRAGGAPYSLVSVLGLGFGLWGRWLRRMGLRITCRTAAAAREPYLVTLDQNKWDGRPAYSKWSGEPTGFGSRIQGDDAAARLLRPLTPVLIAACVLFSLLATAGKGRPELLLWALSATLCAAASLSGALAFSIPLYTLSRRLAGQGAALAGWEGLGRSAKNAGIVLTDGDLFPPGAVTLNGLKVFHNYPLNQVISVTATLIRDMGSGLDRPFHDFLRSQGAVYRRSEDLQCYEGGACAIIRGDEVLVGSASFLRLMEVVLPQGLNVKNAVFCAINGELAGIFALNYSLHATVRPALSALISNKINPILATRDFNLIPAMLLRRFKLPVEKMDFPEHARRRALSAGRQLHSPTLVCVLCREGIGPFADAAVGAKRLELAAKLNATLSAAGSVVGVLLAFYLTAQAAFTSLSVLNLLAFQLMWLTPILLISGWVGRY